MPAGRTRQGGYVWPWLLGVVAVVSLSTSEVAARWSDERARDKEQELLQVGAAYAAALASYRASTPVGAPRAPSRLEDLLLDPRQPQTLRHLRRLWPDPITGQPDWDIVRDARGVIVGVRSRSTATPWTRGPVRKGALSLPAATHYSDWIFGETGT